MTYKSISPMVLKRNTPVNVDTVIGGIPGSSGLSLGSLLSLGKGTLASIANTPLKNLFFGSRLRAGVSAGLAGLLLGSLIGSKVGRKKGRREGISQGLLLSKLGLIGRNLHPSPVEIKRDLRQLATLAAVAAGSGLLGALLAKKSRLSPEQQREADRIAKQIRFGVFKIPNPEVQFRSYNLNNKGGKDMIPYEIKRGILSSTIKELRAIIAGIKGAIQGYKFRKNKRLAKFAQKEFEKASAKVAQSAEALGLPSVSPKVGAPSAGLIGAMQQHPLLTAGAAAGAAGGGALLLTSNRRKRETSTVPGILTVGGRKEVDLQLL